MQNETSVLEKAGETFGFVQQYIEKRIELYRLEVTQKVVTTLSSLIASFFLLSIFGFVLVFGSISAGFYLAAALDSFGLAFLIVTLFYALLALILFIFKRQFIYNPILRRVLNLFREEEEK
jgi:energy-coupling factor transporter transmembrane protein EcfT